MKKRDSNIEMLRIFAMFFIVLHHSVVHGAFHNLQQYEFNFFTQNFANFTVSNLLISGGKVSVAIFILITGYYSVNISFKIKRLIPILIQTFFYSLTGLMIGLILHQNTSIKIIIKQFFPIIFSQYWFITCYVLILLLAPFIVVLLKNLDNRMNFHLFLILAAINIVVPTLIPHGFKSVTNDFSVLLLFFITGYYLNSYKIKLDISMRTGKFLVSISAFLYILSVISIELLAVITKSTLFRYAYRFSNLDSIFVFMFSVGLFIVFKEMKLDNKYWINKVSTLMLGVYLIHDNFFLRPIIWNNIFHLYESLSKNTFVFLILIIGSAVVVFVICALVELMRQIIFKYIRDKFYLILNK